MKYRWKWLNQFCLTNIFGLNISIRISGITCEQNCLRRVGSSFYSVINSRLNLYNITRSILLEKKISPKKNNNIYDIASQEKERTDKEIDVVLTILFIYISVWKVSSPHEIMWLNIWRVAARLGRNVWYIEDVYDLSKNLNISNIYKKRKKNFSLK